MEQLNAVNSIKNAGSWFLNNGNLLIKYTVNVITALLIFIIGLVVAKVVSRTVNRLMKLRGVDITVADFLSTIVRYSIFAFTFVTDLGRLWVPTHEIATSSLNFVVRVWSNNQDSFEVYWDLMENFKRALDANQIGIPYPQMDVHLYPQAKAGRSEGNTIFSFFVEAGA